MAKEEPNAQEFLDAITDLFIEEFGGVVTGPESFGSFYKDPKEKFGVMIRDEEGNEYIITAAVRS